MIVSFTLSFSWYYSVKDQEGNEVDDCVIYFIFLLIL